MTNYKPKGLVVLAEYLKISGLKFAPLDFSRVISKVPDSALQNIGYVWSVIDYDYETLTEALEAVHDSAGSRIPDAGMFISAIGQAARQSEISIIFNGVTEGLKDVGAKAADVAESSRQLVDLVTKAAPLVALVFIGGFLVMNYKKMTKA